MHNGLGYIYGKQPGYMDQSARQAKPQGLPQKGSEYEHRTIHRQRSEVERRRAVHEGHAAVSAVRFLGQVVQILDHVGVGYKGLNVLESAELRNGIKEYSNWPTIPQLYVKGEFVGGCDIIREMFQAGELQQLFADKGVTVRRLRPERSPRARSARRGWKSLLPTSPACALTPSSTPRIRRCLAGAASMARSIALRAEL